MKNKKVQNVLIVLLFIILFIYLSICINSFINKDKIGVFSYKFYIVTSDSKESNVKEGSLIIAKNIRIEDIKENDNVIYKKNNELIVNKIKTIQNNSGKISFFIEENEEIANEKIDNAQIIGKVVAKFEGLGNLALFLQTPTGVIHLIIILVCIAIIIKKISRSIQEGKNEEKEEIADEKK